MPYHRACAFTLALAVMPSALDAQSVVSTAQPASSGTTPVVRNLTRVESWRFFEPPPAGGDADYAFGANWLLIGVRHAGSRHELNVASQYVQFGDLPPDAIGPGALGTGGNYFDHARRHHSGRLYLKTLNVQIRDLLPGLTVRGGAHGIHVRSGSGLRQCRD